MRKRVLVGDSDSDEVLNWLEVHSVSLSQGLPLHLLQQKWRQAGRDETRLHGCLQRLFDGDWLAVTPGVQPTHLRFTPAGYSRLLQADVAAPPGATPAAPCTAPLPQDEQAVPFFISRDRPISEIALRNQILAVYRDLRLRAESRLIAMTLSRYWQEMGLRAGDLRTGLDLLLRDGYLRQRLDGMDVFWVLTQSGEAFMQAPLTPQALLDLAPPMGRIRRTPPDDELRHALLGLYLRQEIGAGGQLDYAQLQNAWKAVDLDTNALLHALDLCLKTRTLELIPAPAPAFRLTADGQALAQTSPGTWSRLATTIGRILS